MRSESVESAHILIMLFIDILIQVRMRFEKHKNIKLT